MAHIQGKHIKLWKPQDLTVDKISSQRMFVDNIDALEAFALSVLNRSAIPVASITALRSIDTSDTTVYVDGTTVMVKSNGLYFFDRGNTTADNGGTIIAPTTGGGRWISDHTFLGSLAFKNSLSKGDVGLGNVPNVATNDQTPTYTQATTLANIASGEKLSVSMGKIAKAIADLISHISNKSNPHGVTKAQLELGNVDNTSDLDKPISNATQEALNLLTGGSSDQLLEFTNHKNNTSNPHNVTKAQVQLGNVPNVSTNDQTPTYTQASTLANITSGEKLTVSMGKLSKAVADLIAHLANKSNPHGVTKAQLELGNVDNTSDANKPVSTAQSTAIADAKKAGTDAQTNLAAHTSSTSNPHKVTKAQVELGNVPNVATNDQTPTYTAASTLAGLTSGEKLSVSMGKIAKGITDLISHLANKSNPHSVTKSQVGLGNVDNTSDANKPISTATQEALNTMGMAMQNAFNNVQLELDGKADMVNGEIATQSYVRLTGYGMLQSGSLNDVKYAGQYGVMNACTDKPSNSYSYGILEVIMYTSHWLVQRYYGMTSNGEMHGIYYRTFYNGSTWSAWQRYGMNAVAANVLAETEVVDE